MSEARTRPGSVTIVVVLLWISFAAWIIAAITMFIFGTGITSAGNIQEIEKELEKFGLPTSWAPGVGPTFLVIGAILVVFAIISALFAVFISKGSNVARILLTIIVAIRIVGSLSSLIATDIGFSVVLSVVFSVAIDVVILFLLYNADANKFFTDKVRAAV
jgi:hypothetical protein